MSRIYVADLAAYNNGRLHGLWIDCDGATVESIWAQVNAMLRESPYPNVTRQDMRCDNCGHSTYYQVDDITGPGQGIRPNCPECGCDDSDWHKSGEPYASAEEWAVHDHEFGTLIKSEWPYFAQCIALAAIMESGESDKIVALHWLIEALGYSIDSAIDDCENVSLVTSNAFDVAKDYAYEFVSDCYGGDIESLPSIIRYNIDYEGIAHDMKMGGEWSEFEHDSTRYLVTNANEF